MSDRYEHQDWPTWLFTADGKSMIFASAEDVPDDADWMTRDELAEERVAPAATGLHQSALGAATNETSGRAILAVDPLPATVAAITGGPVVIPDNWSSLHWKKQASLAKAISGEEPANAAAAKAIIEAEVARRAEA